MDRETKIALAISFLTIMIICGGVGLGIYMASPYIKGKSISRLSDKPLTLLHIVKYLICFQFLHVLYCISLDITSQFAFKNNKTKAQRLLHTTYIIGNVASI